MAADGARLRFAHLPAATPRIACVLVGGFAECAEKYFETMADLAARGVSVWCMDWRGQGGSERPATRPTRPRGRDFDRDAADLIAMSDMLPASLPRILIAHSMGGAIALLALHRDPMRFAAAVLSAPMLGLATRPFSRQAARLLARLATRFGFAETFAPGYGPWVAQSDLSGANSPTSHDPQRCLIEQIWFLEDPDLRVDGPTYGWIDRAFDLVSRLRARRLLKAVSTPILLGCAGQERFVVPRAERRAARLLPDCRLVQFPDARHETFQEQDGVRQSWLDAIDDFLRTRVLGEKS